MADENDLTKWLCDADLRYKSKEIKGLSEIVTIGMMVDSYKVSTRK